MYLFIIIIVIIIREVLCAQWYVTSHNDSVGGRWPQGTVNKPAQISLPTPA